ncbi:MAG: helix-turn-helix transcriptional regulator [Holosporaceae bacterium]|nr:helix-turn-helix transcriptional regulator [Holosporaceae bacterium]
MHKRCKTMRELSVKSGLSASTILRLSRNDGIKGTTLRSLKKISIILECRVKDLVDDKQS